MSAAEAMYFDGAPLAHVVQFRERERLALIERRNREALQRATGSRFGRAVVWS